MEAEVLPISHVVSPCCGGELCRVCGKPATHKLAEEIQDRTGTLLPRTLPLPAPEYEEFSARVEASLAGEDPGFDMSALRRLLENPPRHPLTAYVCCLHFSLIVGQAAPCYEEHAEAIGRIAHCE